MYIKPSFVNWKCEKCRAVTSSALTLVNILYFNQKTGFKCSSVLLFILHDVNTIQILITEI